MKKHWVFRDPSSQEDVTSQLSTQALMQRLIGRGLCVSLLLTTKTIPPLDHQGEFLQ